MPYADEKTIRARLDPDINRFAIQLLAWIGGNKLSGKYFFFQFLVILFECGEKRIGNHQHETGYPQVSNLHGAFECAGKELLRRWAELLPLKLKMRKWETIEGLVKRHVGHEKITVMHILIECIMKPRARPLNDPVKDALLRMQSIALANSGDSDAILSLLDDCRRSTIDGCAREIGYTISEIANFLGNSGKATHQELLDIMFFATNYLYLKHVAPFEDTVATKNGDTAGFLEFFEKFGKVQKKVS